MLLDNKRIKGVVRYNNNNNKTVFHSSNSEWQRMSCVTLLLVVVPERIWLKKAAMIDASGMRHKGGCHTGIDPNDCDPLMAAFHFTTSMIEDIWKVFITIRLAMCEYRIASKSVDLGLRLKHPIFKKTFKSRKWHLAHFRGASHHEMPRRDAWFVVELA